MVTIQRDNKDKIVQGDFCEELVIHNDLNYCGKILRFKAGNKLPLSFHFNKIKTWYILDGEIEIKYLNEIYETELFTEKVKYGSVVEIFKHTPHEIIALTDGELIEFSTQDFKYDNYSLKEGGKNVQRKIF